MKEKLSAVVNWFMDASPIAVALVVVSVYHYSSSLALHGDPFVVALIVAIVVDLSCYRATNNAVLKRGTWILIAIIMFVVSLGLQAMFYTERFTVFTLETALYSLMVPLLMVVIALIDAEREKPVRERLRDEREAFEKERESHDNVVRGLENRVRTVENELITHEVAIKSWAKLNDDTRVALQFVSDQISIGEATSKTAISQATLYRMKKNYNGVQVSK